MGENYHQLHAGIENGFDNHYQWEIQEMPGALLHEPGRDLLGFCYVELCFNIDAFCCIDGFLFAWVYFERHGCNLRCFN